MPTVDSLVRTDYKPVDKRDELRAVIGWLTGDADTIPLVLDGDKPFGIVNERAIMARKIEHKAKIEGYTLVTRALPRTAQVEQAAARMAEFRAGFLPIEDARGKCAGYVSALDVARQSGAEQTARDLYVQVRTLRERETLGEALHLFQQEYVDHLPVVDDGRVVGVLPRRQVVRMELQGNDKGRKDSLGEPFHLLKDPVGGFMEQPPVTVRPTAPFRDVVERLEESGYVIVQDNGGPVLGMITPGTLMRTAGLLERRG